MPEPNCRLELNLFQDNFMAKLKIKDLKNKGGTELKELLLEEREKLLALKMRARESKVKNVKEAKEIRKNIARALTLLKTNLTI